MPTNYRLSPDSAIGEAKRRGWVERPNPTRDWHYQMVCRACQLEEDLYTLVLENAVICDGIGCLQLACFKVRWSDRRMRVCKEHLEHARRMAAADGARDRTGDPRVSEMSQLEIVEKYWPGMIKLFDVDPIRKEMVRKALVREEK